MCYRTAAAAEEIQGSAVAEQRRRVSDAVSAEPEHHGRAGARTRRRHRCGTGDRRRAQPAPRQLAGSIGPSPSGRGTIVGVASKNTGQSIRFYKGKNRYNEWQFIGMEMSTQAGGGAAAGGRGGAQRGRRDAARRTSGATADSAGQTAVAVWAAAGCRGRGDQGGSGGSRSSITAALTSRRRAAPAESAESPCSRAIGFTRLVRNTTYTPRSGSIHNVVPVNPVWPNAEGDIFVPHEDVGSIVSHPSARDPVHPGAASRTAEPSRRSRAVHRCPRAHRASRARNLRQLAPCRTVRHAPRRRRAPSSSRRAPRRPAGALATDRSQSARLTDAAPRAD